MNILCRRRMNRRQLIAVLAGLVGLAAEPAAAKGRHCDLVQPPADAGAFATPGGFLLVYPRNHEVGADYSGCRLIWIMQDATFTPLFIRSQYRRGRLVRVQSYDGRGGDKAVTCVLPSSEPACANLAGHELLDLNLPTWPRVCTVNPTHKVCESEPE